jgi:DNA-binding CsgD family transcriptional regulator
LRAGFAREKYLPVGVDMTLLSPMERVNELVGFLELNPTLEQIVSFLTKSVDPFGEVSGVGFFELNDERLLCFRFVEGFSHALDTKIELPISADHPLCSALRTSKLTSANLVAEVLTFSELAELEKIKNSEYQSGIGMPINDRQIFGITLSMEYVQVEKHREYFEVIRTILASYFARTKFETKKQSHMRDLQTKKLTSRQTSILEMIKEGRTNHSIAEILGYSESLIRQETIIIYRKLGVEGRRDLLNKSNIEEHSE